MPGELAEILGPRGLDADREVAAIASAPHRRGAYVTLPAADRAAFAAYARGVNAVHRHASATICRWSSPCSATSRGRGASMDSHAGLPPHVPQTSPPPGATR